MQKLNIYDGCISFTSHQMFFVFPEFNEELHGPVEDCPCFPVIVPCWNCVLGLGTESIPFLPLPGHGFGSSPEGCQVEGDGKKFTQSIMLTTVSIISHKD